MGTQAILATKAYGTKRDPEFWDRMVNDKFGGKQPVLSPEESVVAARKLYRHAMGKTFPGRVEVTSGNRYTWVRRGVLYVNPDKPEFHTRGLRSLIHDLSHYCHRRLHPNDAPHSVRQARLEAKLVRFALDRGWHEGALKEVAKPLPKKLSPIERSKRLIQLEQRVKRRREEFARAQRLLAKAAKDHREYRAKHFGWLDR